MAARSQQLVAPARSRPGILDALHDSHYRLLWLAGFFVNTARWLDFLVLGWVALELTNSPLMVGLAAFCRSAPMMALGLFAGLLADRFHRGRLLVLVQMLNLIAACALALLFGTGIGGFWHLIGLDLVLGVAWAIDFPSRRTVLYTLVGPGRLANAVSLESASMQGTKMIGPLAGGVLLAWVGPSGCYLALAALFLGALLLVLALTRRVRLASASVAESVVASVVTGFREVCARPTIVAVLAITIVMNVLVFPYQQMLPVFARDVLVVGPELLGLLIAADGLGALTGALVVASRRSLTGHRRIFAGGSLLAATLVVGLALSPWYFVSLPLQFVIGIAESGFGTMQSTLILLDAPERARGRVMGILSVCIGTQPLGSLWTGFATSHVGAPTATALGALFALALIAAMCARIAVTPARDRGGQP